jgi:hypothetical protein
MRRVVLTLATIGLVLLIFANVMTALSASNALPPTRADDVSVVAPPPQSMLLEPCGDSKATDTDGMADPGNGPEPTPEAGCPEDSVTEGPLSPGQVLVRRASTEIVALGSSETQDPQPCAAGCEGPGTATPEEEASPQP